MPRFPVCRICAAILPDDSVEQKHYDWHASHDKSDLRAKVMALPYVLTYGTAEVKRDDVLGLLDGSE